MDEEQGIYRGEVTTMMGCSGRHQRHVETILAYIKGEEEEEDDDEEEEEEDRPSDS